MKRWRLIVTLFLVAGLPILLVLAVFLREIKDLGAWGRTNPLGGVADTLMDKIETRIHQAREQVDLVAADPEIAGPYAQAALARYEPIVGAGSFKALVVHLKDGRSLTLPEALPDGTGPLVPVPAAAGVSALKAHPDGTWVMAMTAPIAAPGDAPAGLPAGAGANGWVTGLFDVSGAIGDALLGRMQVNRWGQAFLADAQGVIFLAGDDALVGRKLDDLGLERTAGAREVYEADGWRTETGAPHFVALAPSHGYYEGPQNGWRAGLILPESVVRGRSDRMTAWVVTAVVAVLVITAGLMLVLRRSMTGPVRP